jgi:hypothetical protein
VTHDDCLVRAFKPIFAAKQNKINFNITNDVRFIKLTKQAFHLLGFVGVYGLHKHLHQAIAYTLTTVFRKIMIIPNPLYAYWAADMPMFKTSASLLSLHETAILLEGT